MCLREAESTTAGGGDELWSDLEDRKSEMNSLGCRPQLLILNSELVVCGNSPPEIHLICTSSLCRRLITAPKGGRFEVAFCAIVDVLGKEENEEMAVDPPCSQTLRPHGQPMLKPHD